MTKTIEALDRSIELWTWMAEANGRTKRQWPGWKNYEAQVSYCFLCTLAVDRDCMGCPVVWTSLHPRQYARCTYEGSPYLAWQRMTDSNGNIAKRGTGKKEAQAVLDLLIETRKGLKA